MGIWIIATDDNATKAAVNIDPKATVFDLKRELEKHYCCEPEFMVLSYNGYTLENELTLEECRLQTHSQVFVHARLIGV
ncbi:Ubiquitin family protein [Giardia muris]|uniref:Ubiquitin family protein n=1 Tax=Giardia muris TaxID=5742 RepID=A0A4Z1SU20_GIAMU|nr:Ubiquitin family protein [Giardia muris]|eukprot:TNJ28475.1 Ubiquitin family protein [Giardia muris]